MKTKIRAGTISIQGVIGLVVGVAILGWIVVGCAGGCGNYSDGTRAGIVTKFSKKGIAVKSYEGELVIGGLRNRTDGKGVEANIFEFTVHDDGIVKEIEKALTTGKRVTLYYRQKFIRGFVIEDTSYTITKVEFQE